MGTGCEVWERGVRSGDGVCGLGTGCEVWGRCVTGCERYGAMCEGLRQHYRRLLLGPLVSRACFLYLVSALHGTAK